MPYLPKVYGSIFIEEAKKMNLFSRIAIGTANWGKEYNGVKVPDKDIEKILGYAQCSGIGTLDCSTAYGWDWTQANSYFNKIIKIQSIDEIEKVIEDEPYCIMAHNEDDWRLAFDIKRNLGGLTLIKSGISLYSKACMFNAFVQNNQNHPDRFLWPKVIQCPYSLYDRRMERWFTQMKNWGSIIHARSVFLRGRIIADGIQAEECIKFVLANPYVNKVIIGADSFDQFRRNLDFIVKWNNLEKHDEKLLDPRKWEES